MGKCYTVLVICGKSLTSTPVLNLREWESVIHLVGQLGLSFI